MDLWQHTLSQIPSTFGRIVYLAGLRDPNSGEYQHHGFAAMFGAAEANRTMKASHDELFAEWLSYGLAHQKMDLELYLSGLEPERRRVVESWTKLEPYRGIPPETARPVERELFLADLDALLTLMRNELGVFSPDPDA
jgi:hypothetical protein